MNGCSGSFEFILGFGLGFCILNNELVSAENLGSAFYKGLMKDVGSSDKMITFDAYHIQVWDARDPLGSRSEDVERTVHKAGAL